MEITTLSIISLILGSLAIIASLAAMYINRGTKKRLTESKKRLGELEDSIIELESYMDY